MKKVFSLIVFGCAFNVFAGVGVGGGDTINYQQKQAWFTGAEKELKFCIKRAPEFYLSKESAKESFFKSVNLWKEYFYNRVGSNAVIPLNFNFKYKKKCSKKMDLVLFLGTENKRIKEIKKSYNDPYAFAYKTVFSEKTQQGRGLLWFKNTDKWRLEGSFDGMMLHELGHIYGNDHTMGTIMDRGIIYYLLEDRFPEVRKAMANNIDHYRFLVGLPGIDFVQEGFMHCRPGKASRLFEILFGRSSRGVVRSRFTTKITKNGLTQYILEYEDDIGAEEIKVERKRNSVSAKTFFVSSSSAFSRAGIVNNSGESKITVDSRRSGQGFSELIDLHLNDGRIISALLNVNGVGEKGPVKISMIEDSGSLSSIFQAFMPIPYVGRTCN